MTCILRSNLWRNSLQQVRFLRRTYLSAAFNCQPEWDSRLDSHVFQKLRLGQFFFDVERKFQREKRGSAIDIDLFANAAVAARDETELEQLEELLHQFRRTPQTVQMLPSTTYAAVRVFVEDGRTDNLMRMIDDRLNYGIFPENYSLVYLLDHFLKGENWRDAAKVAVHMMLQEDVEVPIAKEMGLYGTYKYALLGTPEPWEPQGEPKEPEPEDDVKVRLEYLDSGYFDDHFDLTERNHLIGKTLVKFSRGAGSTTMEKSFQLLGWTLFEKWDKVKETIDSSEEILEECAAKVKEIIAGNEKCAEKESLLASLEKFKLSSLDIDAHFKGKIAASVKEHEPKYIEEQLKCFREWNERRERELEKQFEMYQRESRKEAILRKKKELEEKEEQIFFFERQEEFERIKEDKYLEWRRKLPPRNWVRFGKVQKITLKPKVVVADNYVPPEVGAVKRTDLNTTFTKKRTKKE